jgi:hypothetical protein
VSVMRPQRVSRTFRILGGVLGPGLAGAGVILLGATIYRCVANGRCPGALGWVAVVVACVGNAALGWLLVITARTGEDPFVSDIVDDPDE